MSALPLLTLAMIVKDEATTLDKTLRSVRSCIDRWVIVDTGSTDATPSVARAALEGVPGELVSLPFVDFATTRNAMLEAAGEASTFVLWLDAEDVVTGGDKLRSFLAARALSTAPGDEAFFLRMAQGGSSWSSPRVVRAAARWRFVGVVHEVLCHPDRPPPAITVPDVTVRHDRAEASAERSRRRWERDLALLQAERLRRPEEGRTAFYLAQTLECLGRLEEAVVAYRERVALGGWREEVFEAKLRIGGCLEALGRPWPEALAAFLGAYSYSPHRAEPLFRIADYYRRQQDHPASLLFARRAFELARPKQDVLFVDDEVYRWKAADLVAIAAYYTGDHALGEKAARQAARACPSDPRIQKNLAFYKKG